MEKNAISGWEMKLGVYLRSSLAVGEVPAVPGTREPL